jgi:hypothetical protein
VISEADWTLVEHAVRDSVGTARLRMVPESGHDIFIAVIQPGNRRSLWLEFPSTSIDADLSLPSLRAVEVVVTSAGMPGRTRCQITLADLDLAPVFDVLVRDIASSIASTSGDEEAVQAMVGRLERWRRLLEAGSLGLTRDERRGLVGELLVLELILDAGVPPERAIRGWVGPNGAHQDFQATGVALEVKATTTKHPQTLVITSERELDDSGVASLFLAYVSLDERRGGDGVSLNELVSRVGGRIPFESIAFSVWRQQLLTVGYLDVHELHYVEPGYATRDVKFYRVAPGFPRIIESDLLGGVGDVRYRIAVSGLAAFECAPALVTDGFLGAS